MSVTACMGRTAIQKLERIEMLTSETLQASMEQEMGIRAVPFPLPADYYGRAYLEDSAAPDVWCCACTADVSWGPDQQLNESWRAGPVPAVFVRLWHDTARR